MDSKSFGCPATRECSRFSASNIFSLEDDLLPSQTIKSNYWLAEDAEKGSDQGFVLDLGCKKMVHGVALKNSRNPPHNDRGTRRFKILGSSTQSNGKWQELLVGELDDSRTSSPEVEQLMFKSTETLRYLKFELLEFWGNGGGLQHLAAITADTSGGVEVARYIC